VGEQFFMADDVIEGFGLTIDGLYLVDENGERLYFIVPVPAYKGMYVKEVTV
jgi:hypothetical protein